MDDLVVSLRNVANCAPTFFPILTEAAQEIERLKKEVAKLRKATEWQPIETVPYGDVVLYYPAHTSPGNLGEWIRVGSCKDTPFRKPTHWFPIPQPPATEGGK